MSFLVLPLRKKCFALLTFGKRPSKMLLLPITGISAIPSPRQKVIGKLVCLVLFKILGIGTAEQNWKTVKLIKSGQCSNISLDLCKKQVTLYGQSQQLKAHARVEKLSSVGKFWEDADFKTMKMDLYCKDMWEVLEVDTTDPRRML
jgi:hypothetical protein